MLVVLDRKNVLTLRHEIMFYWPLLGLVFWWPLIYNSLFNSLHFLTSSCENFTNIFYLDQKNVWSLRNEGVGWLSASLIKGVVFCNLGLFKRCHTTMTISQSAKKLWVTLKQKSNPERWEILVDRVPQNVVEYWDMWLVITPNKLTRFWAKLVLNTDMLVVMIYGS